MEKDGLSYKSSITRKSSEIYNREMWPQADCEIDHKMLRCKFQLELKQKKKGSEFSEIWSWEYIPPIRNLFQVLNLIDRGTTGTVKRNEIFIKVSEIKKSCYGSTWKETAKDEETEENKRWQKRDSGNCQEQKRSPGQEWQGSQAGAEQRMSESLLEETRSNSATSVKTWRQTWKNKNSFPKELRQRFQLWICFQKSYQCMDGSSFKQDQTETEDVYWTVGGSTSKIVWKIYENF